MNKAIILLLLLFFVFIVALGIKRSNFCETGNITIETIKKRAHYILPDYKGLNMPQLKARIYNILTPSIVSLGSSRVAQFREKFFKYPFYNLGFTVGNIPDIRNITSLIDKNHIPDLLIFGIDFWWFSKIYNGNPRDIQNNNLTTKILSYVFKPYTLLIRGQNNLEDFINSFSSPAANNIDGTIHDGSFIYYSIITNDNHNDANLNSKVKSAREHSYPFFPSNELSKEHIQEFLILAKKIKKVAKNVIFILPPLSQKVYDELLKHRELYPHLFLLQKTLEEEGIHVIDYSNPSSIQSPDCEMIDGYHGGEITYARILLDIAKKSHTAAEFINKEYLIESIQKFHGHKMIPDSTYVSHPEVDFLNLKCKKQL